MRASAKTARMFGDEGYTTLFHIRGMPVRLHWSFALGMLIFGGLRFAPGVWLGYFVLVAGHELGHGFLARRYGMHVTSLDIHGFGGLCSYSGYPTEYQQSVIAWGGVLAQGLMYVAIQLVLVSLGPPATEFTADFVMLMTRTNLIIAVINLLPLNGLDGGRAWRLPKLWWRARQSRKAAPDDLAAGFRTKMDKRQRGAYASDQARNAPVVRIERAKDGSVRIVAVEPSDRLPEDLH